MKNKKGIAVIPLVIAIVLVGVAGFSIFSWLKTKGEAQEAKEVAEQREQEFKAALEDAQQEAEENAEKAAELEETLAKTEEAMKLAEEKAAQDAEEKAAMIAELEAKMEEEAQAKAEAIEKSESLAEEIASLETKIEEAKEREYALRASMGVAPIRVNPRAAEGIASVGNSINSQKEGLQAIKDLLSRSGGNLSATELDALVRSFEKDFVAAEGSVGGLDEDLIASGEFSPSSSVGQAVSDLQQTAQKQRAIINSLKSMIANGGDEIDAAKVSAMIADLEASMVEMEERREALDDALNASVDIGGGDSAALASFQESIKKAQAELTVLKRRLATAEAEKQAAVERQQELERLSIEVKYDINYQARSFSYQRRLHSMYNKVAHPEEER